MKKMGHAMLAQMGQFYVAVYTGPREALHWGRRTRLRGYLLANVDSLHILPGRH